MDINTLNIEEIKKGFKLSESIEAYQCLICNKTFNLDEIFPVGERFFTAEHQIKSHIKEEHGHTLEYLLSLDKKLTTLTDNQKEIISLMASGSSDKEIASDLSLSTSTVRHLRFTMKEKARQAKVFLSIYEMIFEERGDFMPIHTKATMVDDRYFISEIEQKKILENMFYSLDPLKLKIFSPKEKKKIVILRAIADSLDPEKKYSELELNEVLKQIFHDFTTLRRYLIEYGFMERTKDGKVYKIKS